MEKQTLNQTKKDPRNPILRRKFLLILLPIVFLSLSIGLIVYIWNLDSQLDLEKSRAAALQVELTGTEPIKLSNAELSLRLDALSPIFARDQDVGAIYSTVASTIVTDTPFITDFSKDFSGLYEMKYQAATVIAGTNSYDKLLKISSLTNVKLISMTKSSIDNTYIFQVTFNYANK